jgi:hypothetical protein
LLPWATSRNHGSWKSTKAPYQRALTGAKAKPWQELPWKQSAATASRARSVDHRLRCILGLAAGIDGLVTCLTSRERGQRNRSSATTKDQKSNASCWLSMWTASVSPCDINNLIPVRSSTFVSINDKGA